MNIQLWLSLFGSAKQDEAICGPNTSVKAGARSLTVSMIHGTLDSCCSSHTCHDHTHTRHCRFCWAGPAFACRHPECQAESWAGWACVECRLGLQGAGSVTNWMRRLRTRNDWPGLQPTTITAASQDTQRGLRFLVINTNWPIEARCSPQPLHTARMRSPRY